MTENKKPYDESRPGPRILVLFGLLVTGSETELLSIEALRTSPLSMLYAVALATAAIATLVALRRGPRSGALPGTEAPQTGPVWHESKWFTDPWYQVPAIFCVFVLLSQFFLDLFAGPPMTDQAVWFLVGLGLGLLAVAFGLIGARSKRRPGNEPVSPAGEGAPPSDQGSIVGDALRDPWFSVPAGSMAFLHLAQGGLEAIEEDPESPLATLWLLMPVAGLIVGLATTAVSRTRQERKEAEAFAAASAATTTEEARDQESLD